MQNEYFIQKKVDVGIDQEMAQSEKKNPTPKTEVGKTFSCKLTDGKVLCMKYIEYNGTSVSRSRKKKTKLTIRYLY